MDDAKRGRFNRRRFLYGASLLALAKYVPAVAYEDITDRLAGLFGDLRYQLNVSNTSWTKARQLTINFRFSPRLEDRYYTKANNEKIEASQTVKINLYEVSYEERAGFLDRADVNTPDSAARKVKQYKLVKTATATTTPENSFFESVKFDDLDPSKLYEYTVSDSLGRQISGTTWAPTYRRDLEDEDEELKIVFAACQKYQNGLFTIYEALKKRKPDLLIHLGDWFYELPAEAKSELRDRTNLSFLSNDYYSYLMKYLQYYFDISLQRILKDVPLYACMDDHDIENSAAGNGTEADGRTLAAYSARMRVIASPNNGMNGFNHVVQMKNKTAALFIDTRRDRNKGSLFFDSGRTMLGEVQKKKIQEQLLKLKAQQLEGNLDRIFIVTPSPITTGGPKDMDSWNGYKDERREMLEFLEKLELKNVTFVSGGPHTFIMGNVHVDPDDTRSKIIATEITIGAVTSKPSDFDNGIDPATVCASKGINGACEVVVKPGGAVEVRIFSNSPKTRDLDAKLECVLGIGDQRKTRNIGFHLVNQVDKDDDFKNEALYDSDRFFLREGLLISDIKLSR